MSVSPPGQDVAPDILDAPTAGAKAIRSSAARALGYFAGTVVTVVSAPLLIRHLGVVGFGRYTTVVALVSVVQGVTDVGLASVALREYSVREGEAREAFMRSVLGARLLLTTTGVALAVVFGAVAGYGSDLLVGTVLAGLNVVVINYISTLSIPLFADLRLGWLTLLDVAGKAVGMAFVVVLVFVTTSLVPFLAVPLVPALGTLAVVVRLTRGRVPKRPGRELRALAGLLRETLALGIATILSTLYARVVIILMSLEASGAATGYFSLSSRVVEVAVGIPIAVVGTVLPIFARAARDDHARLRYALQGVFEVALMAGVWLAGILSLGATTIVALLGGASARPAVGVLRILAFALIPVFLTVTWQHGLLALRRHRELLVVNAVGLLTILVLALALIPALAARGAALAVLGGESALLIGSAVTLFRRHPHLRPALRVVPRVLVAGGAAVALATIPGIPAALHPIVATAVYFPALLVLGAVPRELRAALLSRGSTLAS